jgi:hypothetical protein
MSSSTLTAYENSSDTQVFSLASENQNGARYLAADRDIAAPYVVDVVRKLTAPNATGNDHVTLRVAKTERNGDTGKLATMQVLVDISIPKDTSVLTQTIQKEVVSVACSLLNEATAMEATSVNIGKLISGLNL